MLNEGLEHTQTLMLAKERASLGNSNQTADRIIEIGQSVHASLVNQNLRLEGSRSRVSEILGTLGMSQSLMKAIERKVGQDRVLVYGGMVVTIVVLFLVWWFLKS
jgi:golgi SNAP receptor complex member 2